MRTGATQQSPSASPKVTVVVAGDTHISEGGGGNDRLVSVVADDQVWGGQYTIELDNSDEALNAEDYKGEELTLNFGFTDSAGSDIPPLYVHNQAFIAREGKLLLLLNCIDAWGLLAQVNATLVGAAYNQEWQIEANLQGMTLPSGEVIPTALIDAIKVNYGKTIYTILGELITTIGKTLVMDAGDDDGIIDTRKPPINISTAVGGIRNLLDMTKDYLLWRKESSVGKFRVIKPDAHGVVYSYSVADLIFSNVEDAAIVVPNRVTFWAINEAGTDWISGTPAVDTDSYTKLGVYIDRHYLLANMDVDARASAATLTALAEGALAKIQGERSQGILVAPMHCAQELFDKITIIDDKYDTPRTTTGYVHRIIREYNRGDYKATIQLGGVTSGYTPPGGGLPTPLADAEPPKAPDWRTVDWSAILPKAVQGYQHDLHFIADSQVQVSWLAGTIKFYDGTTQAVAAGNTGTLPDTTIRYIYFDLNDASPNVLKVVTDYMAVLTEKTGVLCLVQKGSEAGVNATVIPSYGKEPLLTPDVIHMAGLKEFTFPDGTHLQGIFSTAIQAGYIKLSEVIQTTLYRTVTDDQQTIWTAKPDNMDEIGEGSTYQRVRATQISSGYLKLTSQTTVDGEWYDESGVEIDAEHGINIYGVNNAFTTRATKTGTIQCYVGADGKIYAGAGSVILDSSGITVKGKTVAFYYEATLVGWLFALNTGLLELSSNTGKFVRVLGDAGLQLYSSPTGNIALWSEAGDITFETASSKTADFTGVGRIRMPQRSSAPSSPVNGDFYYDTTENRYKVYIEGAWRTMTWV